MEREIHWLVKALNDYMYASDESKEENLMWRRKFLSDTWVGYSDENENRFLDLPSDLFLKESLGDIYEKYCQDGIKGEIET